MRAPSSCKHPLTQSLHPAPRHSRTLDPRCTSTPASVAPDPLLTRLAAWGAVHHLRSEVRSRLQAEGMGAEAGGGAE